MFDARKDTHLFTTTHATGSGSKKNLPPLPRILTNYTVVRKFKILLERSGLFGQRALYEVLLIRSR